METPTAPKRDIAGPLEIRQMVDGFYESIRDDELLGPVFDSNIADWSKHLPTMYAFGESILFGASDYHGNPFAKHIPLTLEHAQFARWIELFLETVDRLFSGPKAERAKSAAQSIAHSFQIRMGIDPFGKSGQFY